MNSSIFYKFKSSTDFSTISFQGNSIILKDLKNSIIEQKKLDPTINSSLLIEEAQTGEVFKDDNRPIAKNTSVIVRRVPTKGGSSMRISQRNNFNSSIPGLMGSNCIKKKIDIISDDEKLKGLLHTQPITQEHMMGMGGPGSVLLYKPISMPQRAPPQGYICHRCNKAGHFIQHCPTNGDPRFDIKKVRPATGIPRAFLRVIQPDTVTTGEGAVVIPGGGIAIMEPNEKEFEKELVNSNSMAVRNRIKRGKKVELIPQSLICEICKGLYKNAVVVACCGESFCKECINEIIFEKQKGCPKCKGSIKARDIIPNRKIRESVEEYKVNGNKNVGGKMMNDGRGGGGGGGDMKRGLNKGMMKRNDKGANIKQQIQVSSIPTLSSSPNFNINFNPNPGNSSVVLLRKDLSSNHYKNKEYIKGGGGGGGRRENKSGDNKNTDKSSERFVEYNNEFGNQNRRYDRSKGYSSSDSRSGGRNYNRYDSSIRGGSGSGRERHDHDRSKDYYSSSRDHSSHRDRDYSRSDRYSRKRRRDDYSKSSESSSKRRKY